VLRRKLKYVVLLVAAIALIPLAMQFFVSNPALNHLEIVLVFMVLLLSVWCSFLVCSNSLLKKSNDELQRMNATKDKFFSIIAHDLKSPFSSLLGFAEILTLHAENHNRSEVVKYSNMVHATAKRVFQLVENLLIWSRAQIGTLPYRPVPVDVAVQTSNVLSLMRPNAEAKDVVVKSNIDPAIVAYADLNHYDTIMRNLVSNAIKFSKIGGVVSIGADVENGNVNVWVKDSGIGMNTDQLKKLFTDQHHSSESGTMQEKGTGLGLLICKEFVGINKGTIWAESQYGQGSVFKFTLPLYLN
jgi:signal transduction histidine kinase